MESNSEIWTVFLIYAIAIPASVYWLVVSTLQLGADGRAALGSVVGFSGLAFAMWRWVRSA
jgi:hypothetical protein